jgi:hypothetical protein
MLPRTKRRNSSRLSSAKDESDEKYACAIRGIETWPNTSTKYLASFVGVKERLLLVSAYTDYYSNFDGFRLSDRTAQTRRANPGYDCVSSNL